jgi:hypothetical protein
MLGRAALDIAYRVYGVPNLQYLFVWIIATVAAAAAVLSDAVTQ